MPTVVELPEKPGPVLSWAGGDRPAFVPGAAKDWPAVRTWTFARLAALDPRRPVRLVTGTAGRHPARAETRRLGPYLTGLDGDPRGALQGAGPSQVSQFDLLRQFPALRDDLRPAEVFPPQSLMPVTAWIGAATTRTGLRTALLDITVVQVIGRKRFYLAGPGSVERVDAVSPLYDPGARLARIGIADLAGFGPELTGTPVYYTDLAPGDALYIPRGWWLEAHNLSATLLLSRCHGRLGRVVPAWGSVLVRRVRHRARRRSGEPCTCHPPGEPATLPAARARHR